MQSQAVTVWTLFKLVYRAYLDVPNEMALLVLGHSFAPIQAKAPVCDHSLFSVVPVYRHAPADGHIHMCDTKAAAAR